MPNNGSSVVPNFSGELPISQLPGVGISIHVHEGGVATIDGRSISLNGNITGTAVNLGDNVNQTVNWGVEETQAL